MRLPALCRLVPALLLAVALGLAPAQAATITVDSATDDGTGGCTLREAVESANTNAAVGGCTAGTAGNDDIVFDPTVTLVDLASAIILTEDATITGNGSGTTTVRIAAGQGAFLMGAQTVTIAALRLTSVGSTSASGYPQLGGAVFVFDAGALTLTDVLVDNHRVSVRGGAVFLPSGGSLTVNGASTFLGNRARGPNSNDGGGAIHAEGGTVSVTGARFEDNRALGASAAGGAIAVTNGGALDVTASEFVDNNAGRAGGGIELSGGTHTIDDTVFLQNVAGQAATQGSGGALHVVDGASVSISETSAVGNFIGNAADEGGAIWVGTSSSAATLGGIEIAHNIARGDAATQGGGGVYVSDGTFTDTNGSISNNRAIGTEGSGGGVFSAGGTVTLSGTLVDGNRSRRAGGGIEVIGSSVVSITDGATVSNNVTADNPGSGGGLHASDGSVTITGATILNNRAREAGGGIWNGGTATVFVSNTTVEGNRARFGGGLYQDGPPVVPGAGRTAARGIPVPTYLSQSLVYNNDALEGGGLYALGAVGVENSTLAANEARFGGGIRSDNAPITINSATIARNTARTSGGGLFNNDPSNGGDRLVTLQNTIVSENTAPFLGPNLKGRYSSDDHNLISTAPNAATFPAQANDQLSTDPLLGMLADNGGPTRTLALGAGSPAIDAGSTFLTVDQRGEPRSDGSDDVGAYEAAAAPLPALVITGVIDGPRPGGTPKAIEVYVLEDIADLSAYGLGAANNGGGTDGEEFTFPAVAATEGEFIYVASESAEFTAWFGFAPDYTAAAAFINGDDAIELFFNGTVADTFGDINTDGTGQPWEYLDGWAYREDATGPDGSTFTLANWSFSGPDALDGETTNGTAATPFPTGTYTPAPSAARTAPLAAAAADAPVALSARPNPFATRTTASFSVAEAQTVTVALYDVMGRRLQTLYAGPAEAAEAVTVSVDGASLAAGVYVIVLEGERVRRTLPVTVAR